ncbi:plastocyanin [Pelomonas sp. UHG3]|uniref:Plastocyanin n=1 Tax=Roseateles hydrophilus TaxID=2975054 RepID=A0ACC6C530_9BURK|nr:plastocyanin [Pelomonas sp. UHG3]MCY4743502.1 plastocyanin [Pelomonas sp. UHG3]
MPVRFSRAAAHLAHLALMGALAALALPAHAADLAVRVLDKHGQPLADAVVMVQSTLPAGAVTPMLEATIQQQKMRFKPYVTVVHAGARVSFTNLDAWDHHVILGPVGPGGFYLDPGQNQQLRLAGKVGDTLARETRSVTQTGAYLLGCHLHGSMRGHLYVADTPWARVSEADGQARFTALPAGPARVRIWHPDQVLDTAPITLDVAAGGAAVTVNTQVAPVRRRQAGA